MSDPRKSMNNKNQVNCTYEEQTRSGKKTERPVLMIVRRHDESL